MIADMDLNLILHNGDPTKITDSTLLDTLVSTKQKVAFTSDFNSYTTRYLTFLLHIVNVQQLVYAKTYPATSKDTYPVS